MTYQSSGNCDDGLRFFGGQGAIDLSIDEVGLHSRAIPLSPSFDEHFQRLIGTGHGMGSREE